MSDNSPLFFMKEFSNDELANLLINKVNELNGEKAQSQELNERLEEMVAQLEETTAKLEETQEALKHQRDELARDVKQKTEELLKKEQLSVIGELSGRIAHDMRNPLSIIKNSADMIKTNQKKIDPKTQSQWEAHERAVYRISHQVDDVLDYIRNDPITKKPTKISVILQDTLERVEIPSNINLKLPKTDVSIPCDADRLEVVFVNLIMNSIQAIGNEQGEIYIDITEEPDEVVLITVKDNGPGIPKKLIHKIFDPLFTTGEIRTGLGLPSCKNIIEKHGGTIDVSNIRKKGATFLIRLPKKTEWDNFSKIGDKEKLTEYISSVSR